MAWFTHWMANIIVLDLLYLSLPPKILAYLDPGTGSFMVQMLIAGLMGALLVLKLFWRHIKVFFRNLFSKGEKHQEDED